MDKRKAKSGQLFIMDKNDWSYYITSIIRRFYYSYVIYIMSIGIIEKTKDASGLVRHVLRAKFAQQFSNAVSHED